MARNLETELEALTASPAVDLTSADRERLMTLGADLERAWSSASVTPETRKRIARTLIDEIVGRVEDTELDLVIRWHGGDHSDLVRVLARQTPDNAIASVLNRSGKTTGRGNGWTKSRVCGLAATTTSQPIAKASAASAARSLLTRLPRPSPSTHQRATSDQGRPARGEPALQRGTLDHQSSRS
ncbi:hypothetical protein [Bradyrhizobium canariense]|uniref:hypothetical protein n=1 Tax=Bradyrhizobium canariense TaxID=255045 RepID=UPI001F0AD4FB|nr:hypothetical protein [Bradyrhizobium canariense]